MTAALAATLYNSAMVQGLGFGQPLDTADEAAAMQVARWRAMNASEKAALVASMYWATVALADAGIAARYPKASERERFLRRAILHLGRDLAVRVYPDAAQLTP